MSRWGRWGRWGGWGKGDNQPPLICDSTCCLTCWHAREKGQGPCCLLVGFEEWAARHGQDRFVKSARDLHEALAVKAQGGTGEQTKGRAHPTRFEGRWTNGIIEISPICNFSLPRKRGERGVSRQGTGGRGLEGRSSRILRNGRDEGVVRGDEAEAARRDLVDPLRVEVCVRLGRGVSGRGDVCAVLRRCALSAVYPGNLRACNASGKGSAVLTEVRGSSTRCLRTRTPNRYCPPAARARCASRRWAWRSCCSSLCRHWDW